MPWFSKTEGNTYATLLHHPFLFGQKQSSANRGSKKDFWRRCRGGLRKSQHTKYPSQTLISCITLFAICLSFSSPPLHPCRFICPLFSACLFLPVSCLLVCWIACLSRWLKIILNCVTLPIPTIMIFLALRLLLLPILNLVKSNCFVESYHERSIRRPS